MQLSDKVATLLFSAEDVALLAALVNVLAAEYMQAAEHAMEVDRRGATSTPPALRA